MSTNTSSKIAGISLDVNQDFLAEAVKQTVIMGISEALNGKNEIVSQIVNSVLNQKVDEKGQVSSYRNANKYTLLEYYVRNMLAEETKAEIVKIMDERRPEIRKIIRDALMTSKFVDKFTKDFITTVSEAMKSRWDTKIDINIQEKEGRY
jgi:spore coat protein CotF